MAGSPLVIEYKRRRFAHHWAIEAYGVKLGISSNTSDALKAARQTVAYMVPEFEVLDDQPEIEDRFLYVQNPSGRDTLYRNGKTLLAGCGREYVLNTLGSEARMTFAENAVDRVFIHAGAVAWKGKVIIFPAHSYNGKSSLTAEFLRLGAEYYSDEFAVIDIDGYVYPFPKKISIREGADRFVQTDYPVTSFGSTVASGKAKVAMVLLTSYQENSKWRPRTLSPAAGVLEIIRHTLPIRRDPVFTLAVLRQVADSVIVVKSKRGDAKTAAMEMIDYFEKNCF